MNTKWSVIPLLQSLTGYPWRAGALRLRFRCGPTPTPGVNGEPHLG